MKTWIDYLLRKVGFPMCYDCGMTTMFPMRDNGQYPMHRHCHQKNV